MANVNPGPAVNGLPNSLAAYVPVNTSTDSDPLASNGLRLLGSVRGLRLSVVGDPAIMLIVNASRWVPATVITSNGLISGVTGDIHLATVGLYTAAAAGGTAVLTVAALPGQTVSTFAYIRAATAATTAFTVQRLYVNCGVAVAGGTTDLFLYGYDIST